MSVLVDEEIQELVLSANLITSFVSSSLEGASYDMGLGAQYVKGGVIATLTEHNPTLTLASGEFAVLRTLEELNMPLDIIGHNGIMSPWAKRGLVSLFSPQIDPGFEGFLIVPVFNAGDAPIALTYKQTVFTVEFVRTSKKASRGWSSRHGRQDKLVVPVTPQHLRPNLLDFATLQSSAEALAEKIRLVQAEMLDIKTEHRIIQARVGIKRDRTALFYNRWRLIIALILCLVTFISGVLGADWLRRQIGPYAPSLFPSEQTPANKQ
jgi:deoxycytidine triphosphate deaminase